MAAFLRESGVNEYDFLLRHGSKKENKFDKWLEQDKI